MAKKVYFGVNNVARNVKKMYFGVNNVARKVKKAYIGIGGVARPFFSSSKEIEYYGYISPLPDGYADQSPTSIGDYALFGGGFRDSTREETNNVFCYDSGFAMQNLSNLTSARRYIASTEVMTYGAENTIFAGGETSSAVTDEVNAYFYEDLTKKTPSDLSGSRSHAGCTFFSGYPTGTSEYKGYFLIAGGENLSGTVVYSNVDGYLEDTLTRISVTSLSEKHTRMKGSSTFDYAIFAWGGNDLESYSNLMYYYSIDLVMSSYTLGNGSVNFASGVLLDTLEYVSKAVFGGGENYASSTGASDVVITVDNNLTKTFFDSLHVPRYDLACASDNRDFCVFAGGRDSSNAYAWVDCYDIDGVHTILNLNTQRQDFSGACAGDGKFIFSGGVDGVGGGSSILSSVEAFVTVG